MLPPGFGREELLRRLGRAATAGESADGSLLLASATHCIGHLRIKEAAEWLAGVSIKTVQTMNRILGIVGLKLGVVEQPAADSDG